MAGRMRVFKISTGFVMAIWRRSAGEETDDTIVEAQAYGLICQWDRHHIRQFRAARDREMDGECSVLVFVFDRLAVAEQDDGLRRGFKADGAVLVVGVGDFGGAGAGDEQRGAKGAAGNAGL